MPLPTLRLPAALLSLAALAACGPPAPSPFDGTFWRASELDGAAVSGAEVGGAPAVELAFTAGGAYAATGGCNRIAGQAEIGAARMRFPAPAASTARACMPGLEARDRTLAQVLSRTRAYRRDGQRLALLDANGRVIARFDEF